MTERDSPGGAIARRVHLGEMDYWAKWFERTLGFTQLTHFTDQDISTEYSALMSKVMENGTGKCKFPINEPAEGRKKSQIASGFSTAGGWSSSALWTNFANSFPIGTARWNTCTWR